MLDVGQTLKRYMDKVIGPVEDEMRLVLGGTTERPRNLLEGMIHYHMGWRNAEMSQVTGPGGKRIRPVLCMLVTAGSGGDWEDAIPAAAAIELLHNFSLIHDDIQDASPTRRGRPTLWKLWGVPHAINAGDCLFALAHGAMYRLSARGVDAQRALRAARRFDETCVDLTHGQFNDMDFEVRAEVSVSEYLAMIDGKTAALLALCGELGALIAGVEEGTVLHYANFARDLGLAFQVKDDILGIWGKEDEIGKSAATDIATRKKTLPVLYGLSESTRLQELYRLRENGSDFVEEVIAELDAVGARSFARRQAERYSHSALEHLEAANPTGEAGIALLELSNLLLNRQA
jgi:geranylgeranyl diphosphate synthase type I